MSASHDPLSEMSWPEPEAPRRAITEAIRAEVTRDLGASRGASAGVRFSLSLAVAVGCVLAVLVLRGNGLVGDGLGMYGLLGWALVATTILLQGFVQPPGRRVARSARIAAALGVPLLFLGYLALAATDWSLSFGEFLHAHTGGALGCALHALSCGALAGGGLLLLWRRSDPFSPGISGALAGLIGGLSGAVAVGVSCPCGEVWHLWLGHGVVVGILSASGWLVGRRSLSP